MPTVRVRLGARSYPTHVSPGALDRLGPLTAARHDSRHCALISSPRVYRHHGHRAERSLSQAGFDVETLIAPDGERAKTPAQVAALHRRLARARLERHDPLVVLAGGTLGDTAGFAAATYLRGVPLVQVPTTLMAQVDSAVGGKTGVNLECGKNLVGAFWQPGLVLCDPLVLDTLPEREFRSGLAEVVKYGCLASPALLVRLEAAFARGNPPGARELARWITECVRIKAMVVSRDERESDVRRVLNLGHTFGHALETASGYGKLLHGEAVALGLAVALWLSQRQAGLDPRFTDRIVNLLHHCFPRLAFPDVPWSDLAGALGADKKRRNGRSLWVLLERPGRPVLASPAAMDVRRSVANARQAWG